MTLKDSIGLGSKLKAAVFSFFYPLSFGCLTDVVLDHSLHLFERVHGFLVHKFGEPLHVQDRNLRRVASLF